MCPVARVRRFIIVLVLGACSAAASLAEDSRFGGPAPAPGCGISGWTQCIPTRWVSGVQAALQEHCTQYAAGHKARGGIVWCGQVGSTPTVCSLREPAVSSDRVGASWAHVSIRMGGRDVDPFDFGQGPVYLTWGPGDYSGPICQCPANSVIMADASCACPKDMQWDGLLKRCVPRPPDPLVIHLAGPSRTKALPAGPALPFVATVTQGGIPQPGKAVTIAGAGSSMSGSTDAAGSVYFTYIPPVQREAELTITASCIGCSNTAQKDVKVDHCEVCGPTFGNPIQPATGEKQQDETDWLDASPHPLSFVRHYRSHGGAQAGLGPNWSHRFAATLVPGASSVRLQLADGETANFTLSGDVWMPSPGNRLDQLLSVEGGFVFVRAREDRRYRFSAIGLLQSITDRNGWTMNMVYDGSGRLTRVTNAFGRSLQLQYGDQGNLIAVLTTDGQTITYLHSPQLVAVGFPGGARRTYHYEDSRFPTLLTGITDESGRRAATFSYDSLGRANGTQHAGGVGAYTVSYSGSSDIDGGLQSGHVVDPAIYRLTLDIATPAGAVQRHVWTGGDGRMRRMGATQPIESEASAQRLYDASGLPVV